MARLLAYAAFRGSEGVIGPEALAVRPLAVPGAGVRVLAGACAILNRAAGGSYQAYAGRLPSEETLPVAATGSGSGRSDLVVMRVEDPYMPGEPWSDPVDPTAGPYLFPRLIAGVPSTTRTVSQLGLGYSAIALARIDLPLSTGTVTDAVIVDLRRVANPRRERTVRTFNPGSSYQVTATAYGTGLWTNATFNLDIPVWATQAIVRTSVGGVSITVGSAYGGIRTRIGDATMITTQGTQYDESVPSGAVQDRKFWQDNDTISVPSALRGTVQPVTLQAYRSSGSTATVTANTGTSIAFDIELLESPV
ncbi:hypothetical protein AB0O64_37810 [Streptomyces sp. NPDC088341]|uniref:hypothetical protein n=1 Tax=Streptomyces sp. NPDC088341 TaxID=3154870 RepID=UPI003429C18C